MKMNMNRIKGLVSGVAMTSAMLLGVSGAALAQYRDYDRYDDRYDDRYSYDRNDDRVRWDREREKRYAFVLGYHTGYSEGRDTRGYRASYKDMPGYREGTNGYLVWMGSRDTYRDYYRKGYEEGFKDGQNGRYRRYDRDDVERVLGDSVKRAYEDPYEGDQRGHGHRDDDYGRYGRDQVYRIAQQNGYRDGYRHGEEDRQRRRGYNYDHSDRYRDATSGYRSEYRDRDLYRQGYRDGYRRGYDDGYRRGGGPRFGWPF